MIYNVKSHELNQIPLIKGHISEPEDRHSGIYSIKINPSRSLLVTNAHNSYQIGIYKLPKFDPIVLAEV